MYVPISYYHKTQLTKIIRDESDNSEGLPLSRTAVQNLGKWSPPTTTTKVYNLDGTISSFSRRYLKPYTIMKIELKTFACASFSVFRLLSWDLVPYYQIVFKSHCVLCPTYKWLRDYLSDFYKNTVGSNLYDVPYGSYLWTPRDKKA